MMNKRMKELITNNFKLSKTVEGTTTVYIDGDFTEHYIKKHFGNVFCYYDNTTDLKKDFDFYNSVHGEDVIRLFEGLAVEYNPTENYDGYEDTTVDHTGTVGNVGNASTTTKVSAYDSEEFVDSGYSEGDTGNTTTYNNSDTTTTHRHGNLGIRTSAECLTEESKIRFNQFLEYYLNRWVNGVIVGYGDEYDEIDTSEVDYATIEQLNALAETVGKNTENISTLDNSLGVVIGDVSDLVQDVETLDTNVSGIGTGMTELFGMVHTNGVGFYFDYQNGEYGYNTSSTRGADTFHPFKTGGGDLSSLHLVNTQKKEIGAWNTQTTYTPVTNGISVLVWCTSAVSGSGQTIHCNFPVQSDVTPLVNDVRLTQDSSSGKYTYTGYAVALCDMTNGIHPINIVGDWFGTITEFTL